MKLAMLQNSATISYKHSCLLFCKPIEQTTGTIWTMTFRQSAAEDLAGTSRLIFGRHSSFDLDLSPENYQIFPAAFIDGLKSLSPGR